MTRTLRMTSDAGVIIKAKCCICGRIYKPQRIPATSRHRFCGVCVGAASALWKRVERGQPSLCRYEDIHPEPRVAIAVNAT